MDAARAIRDARLAADLTQAVLAERAGTSQATVSAYESGHKTPSLPTLSRLLAAAGRRLSVERAARPVLQPTAAQHAKVSRGLIEVLALAEALPSRPAPQLRFPRLPRREQHDAA